MNEEEKSPTETTVIVSMYFPSMFLFLFFLFPIAFSFVYITQTHNFIGYLQKVSLCPYPFLEI